MTQTHLNVSVCVAVEWLATHLGYNGDFAQVSGPFYCHGDNKNNNITVSLGDKS